MDNDLGVILSEIEEYCRMSKSVEPTQVPRLEVVLENIRKRLEALKEELQGRLMDISCGTKPNRTECWAIREVLGEETSEK